MLDDSTCISEVTSAISRIRMQSSNTARTASSSSNDIDLASQSPDTLVRESPESPLSYNFRLSDIMPSGAASMNASCFKIPIIGYEILEERARFTVYKLRIENRITGDCWFVFRRYTDFVRFFSKLKTDFPLVKLILPRKRWIGNNFDPDFLKDRIHGLQCFVNSILEHQELCTSPAVQDFFCLNEPPACAESLEESHAIFEALEETVYHLRCQLKEKELELNKARTLLAEEIMKKDKLSEILRDSVKGCPECGKNFTDLSSPLCNTSALNGIVNTADKEGSAQTQGMEQAKAQL